MNVVTVADINSIGTVLIGVTRLPSTPNAKLVKHKKTQL
jgi:hypothetical protein